MKTREILAILNEIIAKTVSGSNRPIPEPNIVWVYFPQAKSKWDDWTTYANDEPVWIGLYANRLAKYSSKKNKAQIVFKSKTAWINPKGRTNPKSGQSNWVEINLSQQPGYHLDQNCDQVKLTLPSEKELILPLTKSCQTHVNQTVFVDGVFGDDRTGQVEDSCFPFRTINRAIQAIPPSSLVPGSICWNVLLAPGRYQEIVRVPSCLALRGAGENQTFIQGLHITGYGASNVTDLSITGSQFPLVIVDYNDPAVEVNRPISLTNVHLTMVPSSNLEVGPNNVILLKQSTGSLGNINLRNVNVSTDLSQAIFNSTQVRIIRTEDLTLGNVNFEVKLNECFLTTLGPTIRPVQDPDLPPASLNLIHSFQTRLFIEGGLYSLTGPVFTGFQQTALLSQGGTLVHTNSNVRIAQTFPSDLEPPYLLYQAIDSTIRGSQVAVNFVETLPELQAMAEARGDLSKIVLIGLTFISGVVPKILGDKTKVSYSGHDQNGSMISGGTLATKIRRWSENPTVEPSDSTIIVDVGGATIPLIEIPPTNQTQTFKGVTQIFKNNTPTTITLTGTIANTSGSLQVAPNQSVHLQADATSWQVVNVSATSSTGSMVYQNNVFPTTTPITVPEGTTFIKFQLVGAAGGDGNEFDNISGGPRGYGGYIEAVFSYFPGDNYYVITGGQGGNGNEGSSSTGGSNGGGIGQSDAGPSGGGGGGASDVRRNGTDLSNRILVAGGGGGGGSPGDQGGNAGYQNGQNGGGDGDRDGKGGTQMAGGTGGKTESDVTQSTPGTLGQGGNGASSLPEATFERVGGGGGGGGYYGGGGGGYGPGAGGGGGSSFVDPFAISFQVLPSINQMGGFCTITFFNTSALSPC